MIHVYTECFPFGDTNRQNVVLSLLFTGMSRKKIFVSICVTNGKLMIFNKKDYALFRHWAHFLNNGDRYDFDA